MGNKLAVWAPDCPFGAHLYVKGCVDAVRALGSKEWARYLWVFDWNREPVEVALQEIHPKPRLVLEVCTTEGGWTELAAWYEEQVAAVVYPQHCEDFVLKELGDILPKSTRYVCADRFYSPFYDPVRLEWSWEFTPEPDVLLPPRSAVMGMPLCSEIDRGLATEIARFLDPRGQWLIFWGKGNVEAEWVLPVAPNVLWFPDVTPIQYAYLVRQAEVVVIPEFDALTLEILTAWRFKKPVWVALKPGEEADFYPLIPIGMSGVHSPEELYLAYCREVWAPRLLRIAQAIGGGT